MSLDAARVRARLADARLYLLLTRALCRRSPQVVLDEALEAGVDLVQVREPLMGDREFLEWVHLVRERTALHAVPLIVNDRPDLCLLTAAEGVHVGQADLPPRAVRELVGGDALVGMSTHGREQVIAAESETVDYVGLGPLFDTVTKRRKALDRSVLLDALHHSTRPVFGVGGIAPGTVDQALAWGFERVAVSSAVCGAERPGSVVEALCSRLDAG